MRTDTPDISTLSTLSTELKQGSDAMREQFGQFVAQFLHEHVKERGPDTTDEARDARAEQGGS